MDKFQAIVIFRAVVERGGFTAAAKELGVSASAATKNVSALERHLGVQLINRSTRKFALTESGREFFDSVVPVLAALGEAESALREKNQAARGCVRIVMPPSFGRVTFVPELPAFYRDNPEIKLDVHFTDTTVDLIKEGFDLGVRSREQEDSQLIQRILHRGPMVTVGSPAYLEAHGVPRHPSELTRHRCITGMFGRNWRFQDPRNGTLSIEVDGNPILRSGDTVREGAVAGLGLAQSTWWLFRRDLAAGRLVRILQDYEREAVPISVCYPAKRYIPRKVAYVIEFLVRICTEPAPVATDKQPATGASKAAPH